MKTKQLSVKFVKEHIITMNDLSLSQATRDHVESRLVDFGLIDGEGCFTDKFDKEYPGLSEWYTQVYC